MILFFPCMIPANFNISFGFLYKFCCYWTVRQSELFLPNAFSLGSKINRTFAPCLEAFKSAFDCVAISKIKHAKPYIVAFFSMMLNHVIRAYRFCLLLTAEHRGLPFLFLSSYTEVTFLHKKNLTIAACSLFSPSPMIFPFTSKAMLEL